MIVFLSALFPADFFEHPANATIREVIAIAAVSDFVSFLIIYLLMRKWHRLDADFYLRFTITY